MSDETLDEAKRRMRARRNRQATAQLARSVRDLLRDQRPVRPRLP